MRYTLSSFKQRLRSWRKLIPLRFLAAHKSWAIGLSEAVYMSDVESLFFQIAEHGWRWGRTTSKHIESSRKRLLLMWSCICNRIENHQRFAKVCHFVLCIIDDLAIHTSDDDVCASQCSNSPR